MGLPLEPDDVDFVVASHDSDPASIQETIDYINEYKQRPGYAEEIQEAHRILESLGMDPSKFGEPDPGGLLAQWRRNVEKMNSRRAQGPVVVRNSNEDD